MKNFDLYGNLFYNKADAIFVTAVILFELSFVGFMLYSIYEYLLFTPRY
jgi:hypothetical protein